MSAIPSTTCSFCERRSNPTRRAVLNHSFQASICEECVLGAADVFLRSYEAEEIGEAEYVSWALSR